MDTEQLRDDYDFGRTPEEIQKIRDKIRAVRQPSPSEPAVAAAEPEPGSVPTAAEQRRAIAATHIAAMRQNLDSLK